MSLVYLLRHAKAVWPTPSQKDFDRTLDKDGTEAAQILQRRLEVRVGRVHRAQHHLVLQHQLLEQRGSIQ